MPSQATHIVNTYFTLFNRAANVPEDLERLVSLFAPDASIVDDWHPAASGRDEIRAFFRSLYESSPHSYHVWTVRPQEGDLVVTDWAVTGRRRNGPLLSLSGTDTMRLNADGKIVCLRVSHN